MRDGTELRATKQMERGGNPSHSAYCIYLYNEFVLFMQYQCKVFTEIGLLILYILNIIYILGSAACHILYFINKLYTEFSLYLFIWL